MRQIAQGRARRGRLAPVLLALGVSGALATGAVAEPDKPKPKDGLAVSVGQDSQAAVASSARGATQAGSPAETSIIGVLQGSELKAKSGGEAAKPHPGGANLGKLKPPPKP